MDHATSHSPSCGTPTGASENQPQRPRDPPRSRVASIPCRPGSRWRWSRSASRASGCSRRCSAPARGASSSRRAAPNTALMEEELHDVLFRDDGVSDRQGSPARTHAGTRIRPVVRGAARRRSRRSAPSAAATSWAACSTGAATCMMEKTCPEHGYVTDRIFTGTALFLKMQQWSFREGAGLENPQVTGGDALPERLRPVQHAPEPHAAGADRPDQPLQPELPDLLRQRQRPGLRQRADLRRDRRLSCEQLASLPAGAGLGRAVHRRRADASTRTSSPSSARRREMGFSHLQAASNGIQFAKRDFALAAAEAGLHTLYLQFDGTDDAVYEYTRGRKLLETKLQALENIHAAGMKVCLVPTIVRGVNDDQVGEDPPVRHRQHPRRERHRLPAGVVHRADLAGRARGAALHHGRPGARSGGDRHGRPACATSIRCRWSRRCRGCWRRSPGDPKITATSHPTCSSGTYFVVDKHRNAVPITRFLDVEGLFPDMEALAARSRRRASPGILKLQGPVPLRQALQREGRRPRG